MKLALPSIALIALNVTGAAAADLERRQAHVEEYEYAEPAPVHYYSGPSIYWAAPIVGLGLGYWLGSRHHHHHHGYYHHRHVHGHGHGHGGHWGHGGPRGGPRYVGGGHRY